MWYQPLLFIGVFFLAVAALDVSGIMYPQFAQVEFAIEQAQRAQEEVPAHQPPTMPVVEPHAPPPPQDFIQHEEFFDEFDEFDEPEFFIDPRQIEDAKRQVKDLTRRIKEVNRLVKKYGTQADIEALNAIANEINQFGTILNSGDEEAISESIQDFWDGEYWQSIDDIDRKVRVPKEINDLNKQLKRVEKLLSARKKSLQTVNTILGLDTSVLNRLLSQIKEIVTEADRLAKTGELEEASEVLREIYDGGLHPGGIEGMVQELSGLATSVKRIKNQTIIAQIKALISEPLALLAEENVQGAGEAFNDIRDQLYRLIQQGTAVKTKRTK